MGILYLLVLKGINYNPKFSIYNKVIESIGIDMPYIILIFILLAIYRANSFHFLIIFSRNY